ncbi:MAG: SDR family NAD(P)-dependent oxidoreductase [Kiloniellales bacterium]|nr:SDR family NAD(P)-dependent oxidoreductase [Kiloniellales bacterium]
MAVLVTGAAGLIGYHLARRLLENKLEVVGIDNLNSYYDPALKEARLAQLNKLQGFEFERLDITDYGSLEALMRGRDDIDQIVHLAAQAGVRHSLKEPRTYIDVNVMGHLNILEICRFNANVKHLVYASSSSVYGANEKTPYSVEDRVDNPVSLYGATKRSGELISESYSRLYKIPMTGLRFFTVYGPWGRPDMAAYLFASAIFENRPIDVFNHGRMRRDFTYVDDIVDGILGAMQRRLASRDEGQAEHEVYNLGNHRSETLEDFISTLEALCGRKAKRNMLPIQPGDVLATHAEISKSTKDLGFRPKTTIREGLDAFVRWYREYHQVDASH